MPKKNKSTKKPQETQQIQPESLEKATEILSELSQSQDEKHKKKLYEEFLKILPRLNKFFQETLLFKESNELKIDIVKLIKKQLRKADSIFASSDENSQKQLTKFVFLALKSTAKQNQFQTDLANYLQQKFINIDSVLIEKEGIVFQKNPDGTYSKKPVGTADVVIKIINKKGEVISQYCVECDGNSHTDTAKDDLRNTYLSNNSNGFLCLKHGNIDFADYLLQNKDKAQKLNNIAKEINKNEVVIQEKAFLKEQIQERKPMQARPKKLFYNCDDNDDKEIDELLDESRSSQEKKLPTKQNKSKKPKSEGSQDDIEALEEAKKIAEEEQKLIDLFYQNIEEEQWDVFLEDVSEICQKNEKSRSQLDSYLLNVAKTYVAELLKTNYKHECFVSNDFFAGLGAFDMKPDEILYIANNLLQNEALKIEGFTKLIKTAFTSGATVLDYQDARYQKTLQICCFDNYLHLFKYLQKNHEKFSKKIDLMSCLKFCSYGNSYEIAKLLLEQNKTLFQKETKSLCISLCIAAFEGSLEMVEVLLNNGADVNSVNDKRYTILMLAAQNGHTKVVELLLGKGADVNSKLNTGQNALLLAAENGHTKVVELLLNNGANVDSKLTTGETALLIAAQEGYTEIARLLLGKRADVYSKLNTGPNALMLAAQNGRAEIVELLLNNLNNRANVNSKIKDDGLNSLLIAAQNGHIEVVRLLLDKGVDVNSKLETGETALLIASQNGRIEVVKLLLEKKANVNSKLETGETALLFAAQFGHTKVVELLLDKLVDVDLQNEDGITALLIAAQNGHTKVVRLLLDKLVDVDLQNEDGITALMLASIAGHKEIVELLLGKGANVNLQNKNGMTALMNAAHEGHIEVVKLLLEKDADVDVKLETGETASTFAARNRYPEILRLLVNHLITPSNNPIAPQVLLSKKLKQISDATVP